MTPTTAREDLAFLGAAFCMTMRGVVMMRHAGGPPASRAAP